GRRSLARPSNGVRFRAAGGAGANNAGRKKLVGALPRVLNMCAQATEFPSRVAVSIEPLESKDNHMDFLGVGGLLLGVIGIPLAFFVGRRNRQQPDLRLVTDFDQIVAPSDFAAGGEIKLAWAGLPL